jgi:hypothetical protein
MAEKTKAELEAEIVDLKKENKSLNKKLAGKESYAKAHKNQHSGSSKTVEHQ